MRSLIVPVLLAALALPAAAAAPTPDAKMEAKVSKALAGRIAGKPQSCIRLRPGLSSQTVGNALIYEESPRQWYVNRPAGGQCTELATDAIVVTNTPSTQLCRGDIIQLIDRTSRFQRGACGLGDFVPYEKPKAAKK